MKACAWLVIFSACAFSVRAQSENKILSAEELIRLIPDKIEGYRMSDESQSKVMRMGTLQYAMADKRFIGKKQKSIKILLFDYKEAPIMYNQATKKFNNFTPIESDSIVLRAVAIKDCTGWESYHVQRRNSQILLGVCNRFFLTIEGENVELEFLKKVVQSFKIDLFPK